MLGLLAEQPQHGFAMAKELGVDGGLGRIYTVRRSQVYRALDRMVTAGLAEPMSKEPGDGGPARLIHRITGEGGSALDRWLAEPVPHIRDLRIEFMLKLAFLTRRGVSPAPLVRLQLDVLEEAFRLLGELGEADHVDLWRKHNARAASGFLEDLLGRDV